jgi:DNA-binding transcriptional ArsR family regulator
MASPVDKFEEWAGVFLALGNKTKLAILQLLSKKEMNVSAMQENLPCPQSTISHHLNLLYLAGLVVRRREHRKMFYSIADLSKHRLGKKSKAMIQGCNAAKFGPIELVLLQKAGQSNNLEEIAEVFKLLNHKDRLRIVALLTKGELNVMGNAMRSSSAWQEEQTPLLEDIITNTKPAEAAKPPAEHTALLKTIAENTTQLQFLMQQIRKDEQPATTEPDPMVDIGIDDKAATTASEPQVD